MPHIIYIFDAYCGWCYGFGPASHELAKRGNVTIDVKHGSLFQGENSKTIGEFPHIPGANARIAELTGVSFGPDYEALLADGTLLLESYQAAIGLSALKSAAGAERGLELANAMQQAFYLRGLSLSEPATYADIAERLGLDAELVVARLGDSEVIAAADADQQWGIDRDLRRYPTLVLETPDGYVPIGTPTSTADEIEAEIAKVFTAQA